MSLFLGLLFSSIGVVFMIAGKRSYSAVWIVCGALLVAVSYLIDNALALTLVGIVLTALPFASKRGWF